MMGKAFRWLYLLSTFLLMIGQAISPSMVSAKSLKDSGIEVGISMTDPISSQQKVTTVISIQGSENEMSIGSKVIVNIPGSTVQSGVEGINLVGAGLQGFDGPTITKVGDNYQLVYVKNSESVAGGEQATISWTSPGWYPGDEPGEVESTIKYEDAQDTSKNASDSTQSNTKGTLSPAKPDFGKWTMMAKTDDIPNYKGVALMNPSNSAVNVYDLPVNYGNKKMSNATVKDVLPADTHFVYPGISVQTDLKTTNNIRILKLNGSGFTNVTEQFAGGIKVNGRTLSVDFGNAMNDGSAYVVEYAVAPDDGQTPTTYGVKANSAELNYMDSEGDSKQATASLNQAIDDNSNGSFKFTKEVKQTEYLMGSKYLDYTIKLTNNHNFLIPSGSIIEDVLPMGLDYVSTDNSSTAVDVKPSVAGQNVQWTLNQDLDTGESAVVHFRVKVDESQFQPGEKINNKAVLHRVGSKDINSNTTTILVFNGKIKISKTDAETETALAGAEFDILDQDGKVVDHVKTSSDGAIISKTLPTGDYSVKETKAPEGYELSEKDYTVHLDYQHAKNGIVEVNVEDIPDTTSTTDTSDTTDTTSTTDTSDTTDTTSTTDTSDTTDTISTTDTSDTTDTTSTTDTSDTTDTTSTTDTSDTTDTTSTTDTSDTTDTTSTTDTSDTTDTTSTTDTSDTTDTTSTTDTSDTTDTTSTTDTSDTTDTTSTTDTSDTTDTTSTSNSTKNSVPKLPGKITSGSSGTSTSKKGNSTSKKSSGLKSPLASLLPQTGEKGGWILTFVGVVILGVVGWFVFKKKR
ncbi:SpaA isopeptide-forming pilin-related protein [Pediococcus pentosaceus]